MTEQKSWRRDPFFWLTLALVLLLMAVIFAFSAQPVERSIGTSNGVVSPLIRWLFPDYFSWTPEKQADVRFYVSLCIRKTAHVLEFTALGFALRLHLSALLRHRAVRLPGLWTWGIGTLYAATDELHQFFVPGRGPLLADVGIDSFGVLLGLLFFLLCARLLQRRKRSTSENNQI